VKAPRLIEFKSKIEPRGNLSFTEGIEAVPFDIKRVYWLYNVPENQQRGGHAHKSSEQVIICTKGQIKISLESQKGEELNFVLDRPRIGLYIPPLWWGKMLFLEDAIMIGLASDDFSEEDYIRNKSDF
jgi:dTDP-4-dehydrorhamnose 3,5-epimerase-like enzyme